VQLLTKGNDDDLFTFAELLHDQYAACAASLIVLQNDPTQTTAVGMTNLIEAMAMARPVIVTRTGALPTEIDVEQAGCGLHVPPNDAPALAAAINRLATDHREAEAMGERGRTLCESRFNITRYAADLHQFFESL
jgi:glycosyltransferase involved in cell wall biosynthesis